MGFHKRWINKENLTNRYKNGGLNYVKSYLKADALISEDEFSSKVLDLLNNNNEQQAIKLLEDGNI